VRRVPLKENMSLHIASEVKSLSPKLANLSLNMWLMDLGSMSLGICLVGKEQGRLSRTVFRYSCGESMISDSVVSGLLAERSFSECHFRATLCMRTRSRSRMHM
jgi:hypothetical protein